MEAENAKEGFQNPWKGSTEMQGGWDEAEQKCRKSCLGLSVLPLSHREVLGAELLNLGSFPPLVLHTPSQPAFLGVQSEVFFLLLLYLELFQTQISTRGSDGALWNLILSRQGVGGG